MCIWLCDCDEKSDLVLFEVTQRFDNDRAAALLFRVSGFQSHNVLRAGDQMMHLPLVLQYLLLLPLEKKKRSKIVR